MQNQGLRRVGDGALCKWCASRAARTGEARGCGGGRDAGVGGRTRRRTDLHTHLHSVPSMTPNTPAGVNPSPASVKHGVVLPLAGSLAHVPVSAVDMAHGRRAVGKHATRCGKNATNGKLAQNTLNSGDRRRQRCRARSATRPAPSRGGSRIMQQESQWSEQLAASRPIRCPAVGRRGRLTDGSYRTATRACGRPPETDNRRAANMVQGTRHACLADHAAHARAPLAPDQGHTRLLPLRLATRRPMGAEDRRDRRAVVHLQ